MFPFLLPTSLVLSFFLSYSALIQGPPKSLSPLSLDQEIHVTVWNILKGERASFKKEFSHLAKHSDLMLLQEVLLDDNQREIFKSQSSFSWIMAKAWQKGDSPTGTAALSRFQINSPQAVLSRDGQPIANTPKSSVLFKVPIEGGQPLLVVSTHAINFTLNGPFKRLIEALGELLKDHDGPILWAGDFNTWRPARREILSKMAGDLGMDEIVFKNDPRHLVLDHSFIRGLKVTQANVLDTYEGSDHWPLYFVLESR